MAAPWVAWAVRVVLAEDGGTASPRAGGVGLPPREPDLVEGAPVVEHIIRIGMGPMVHKALEMAGDERAHLFAHQWRSTLATNIMRMTMVEKVMAGWLPHGAGEGSDGDHGDGGSPPQFGPGPGHGRVCLIKGAATVARFPWFIGLRPMVDVDILADYPNSPNHGTEVATIFTRAGFCPVHQTNKPHTPRLAKGAFEETWVVEEVEGEEPVRYGLDIHRGFSRGSLYHPLVESCLAGARVLPDSGLPVPDPFYGICVIAAHGARHRLMPQVRELVDLCLWFRLIRTPGEMDRLVNRARECRVTGALYLMVSMALRLWRAGGTYPESEGAGGVEQVMAGVLLPLKEAMGPITGRMITNHLESLCPCGLGLKKSGFMVTALPFVGPAVAMAGGSGGGVKNWVLALGGGLSHGRAWLGDALHTLGRRAARPFGGTGGGEEGGESDLWMGRQTIIPAWRKVVARISPGGRQKDPAKGAGTGAGSQD